MRVRVLSEMVWVPCACWGWGVAGAARVGGAHARTLPGVPHGLGPGPRTAALSHHVRPALNPPRTCPSTDRLLASLLAWLLLAWLLLLLLGSRRCRRRDPPHERQLVLGAQQGAVLCNADSLGNLRRNALVVACNGHGRHGGQARARAG